MVRFFLAFFLVVGLGTVQAEPARVDYTALGSSVEQVAGYWFDQSAGHVWVGLDQETGEGRLLKLDYGSGKILEEFLFEEGWIDELRFDRNSIVVLVNYARNVVRLYPKRRTRKLFSWRVKSSGFEVDAPFRLFAKSGEFWSRGGYGKTDHGLYRMELETDLDFTPILTFRQLLDQAELGGSLQNIALAPGLEWGVFTSTEEVGVKMFRFEADLQSPPTLVAHGPGFGMPALTKGGTLIYALRGMDSVHALTVSTPGSEEKTVRLPQGYYPARLMAWPDAERVVVSGVQQGEQKLYVLDASKGWQPTEVEVPDQAGLFRYQPGSQGRLLLQDRNGLTMFKL